MEILWPPDGPLTVRLADIGWVVDCVDDVWADVLHYYGRDIWDLDGPAAMKLAWRLPDVVDVNASADPPRHRSSVFAHLTADDPGPAAGDSGGGEVVDVDDLDEAALTRLAIDDAFDVVIVDPAT